MKTCIIIFESFSYNFCLVLSYISTEDKEKISASTSAHYSDVIMSAMGSEITGISVACSTICLGADKRKHQSSTSLAFVSGIHR